MTFPERSRAANVADLRASFVKRVLEVEPATVLDVGCGGGAILAALREAGVLAFGVEPDPVAPDSPDLRPGARGRIVQAAAERLPLPDAAVAWAAMLAISRAIGETMIVVMAAGLGANLTANPLEAVTTVTVQIVTLLVGDQEFDSAKTLAAFALGLMLFLTTLMLNIVALRIVKKYREQYE